MLEFMVHVTNCITVGVEGWELGGGGFAVSKLRASRENMKGNSETQRRINGNWNRNGNEVEVLEEMTYFEVSK
jgi:hypothetical protein